MSKFTQSYEFEDNGEETRKKAKGIQWDEETIAEQDKERGTR